MTIEKLIEHLKKFPKDTEVCYTDGAFGGVSSILEEADIYIFESNCSHEYGKKYLKMGSEGCSCHLQ